MRRYSNLSATMAAMIAATVIVVPSAHAEEFLFGWISRDSPRGGYSDVEVYMTSGTSGFMQVCDSGAPDGLRAVGILEWGSYSKEVQDAGGSNGLCETEDVSFPRDGSGIRVTVWSCLRNGATGVLQYCDSNFIFM
ncbi:hypothetical protein [Archangium lansingense]|uniref:Uncharacterized protein n=1 Tax=Archangium lansingense TaxID=2995310 RepID=A0ABT3ZVD1_9BACT|nr:hypothetical protein [Archangium lansinium]MCY1073041.1 hypothetical protein [Archangium lansinium]